VLEPDTRNLLLGQGLDSVGSTQEELAAIYGAEVARRTRVLRALGLQAN
jgi:hypothetical protein